MIHLRLFLQSELVKGWKFRKSLIEKEIKNIYLSTQNKSITSASRKGHTFSFFFLPLQLMQTLHTCEHKSMHVNTQCV